MESFWLAETLKYTYMLQLDTADSIDLDKYVMNTVSKLEIAEKAQTTASAPPQLRSVFAALALSYVLWTLV